MGERRPKPQSQRATRQGRERSDAARVHGAPEASETPEAPEARESGQHIPASGTPGTRRALEGAGSLEEVAAPTRTGVCPVCGTEFDPSSYQVLVSALGRAPFDRVECADIALADRRRAESELAQKRRRRRSRA